MNMDTRQLNFYQWSVCLPLSFAPSCIRVCKHSFICVVVHKASNRNVSE